MKRPVYIQYTVAIGVQHHDPCAACPSSIQTREAAVNTLLSHCFHHEHERAKCRVMPCGADA